MRFFFRLALSTCLGSGALFGVLAACSSDGNSSFGPNFGDLPPHDGAADAPADGDIVDLTDGSTDGPKPGCTTGAVAVLAGQNDKVTGAVDRGRGFAVALITGATAVSFPALAAVGDGFLAVTRGASNALQWSQYTTAWSKPATLGAGIQGAPTLSADATGVHLVYPSVNQLRFQHNVFDGTSWGNDEAVVGPTAATYSFGTDSAGIAVTGQDLAWAENGSNYGLYTRSRGAAWTDATAANGAGTNAYENGTTATPQLVAIEGTYDAVAIFVGHDRTQANHVGYLIRKTADKTWSFGGLLDPTLTTFQRLNIGRTRGGDVIVTMRASAGSITAAGTGYYFRGTVSNTGVTFGAAMPIGGDAAIAVDSAPSVAKGVCGDDAIIAFSSLGVVEITRLRGDAWTAPAAVGGAVGYQVSVATLGN